MLKKFFVVIGATLLAVYGAAAMPASVNAVSTTQAGSQVSVVPTVTQASVQIAGQGLPGDVLWIGGQGFTSGARVAITAFGSTMQWTVGDGYGGVFYAPLKVPANTTSGTYEIKFDDGTHKFSYWFYVPQFNPQLSPNSWNPLGGNVVSFDGSGFAFGERVDLFANGRKVASAIASADAARLRMDEGNLHGAFQYKLPRSASNSLIEFRAVGQRSHASTAVYVWVS